MKKKFSLLLVLMMMFTIIPMSSFAAEKLQIQGKAVDAMVMEHNGVKMFPLRYIGNAYGIKLDWNKEQMKVGLMYGAKNIEFMVGTTSAMVDGVEMKTDHPVVLSHGRVYVSEMTLEKFLNITVEYQDGNAILTMKLEDDIVDIAVASGSFKTLVAAVQAAGLVDALKGEGPFTVFAPTDGAFEKLPEGTVDNLLKDVNKDALVDILTYHVYPGKVMAKDAVTLVDKEVKMLNGKMAKITADDKDGLFIDGAKIIATDIEAKNGVIHVIDSVMLP